jgi:hypothetical protein
LANVLFANELNRRLPNGSTANSLHPGIIATNLGRHMQGGFSKLLGVFMAPFMVSIAQGAATSCYVATSPELAGVGGRYFANCKPARVSKLGQDEALAEQLWSKSTELVAD